MTWKVLTSLFITSTSLVHSRQIWSFGKQTHKDASHFLLHLDLVIDGSVAIGLQACSHFIFEWNNLVSVAWFCFVYLTSEETCNLLFLCVVNGSVSIDARMCTCVDMCILYLRVSVYACESMYFSCMLYVYYVRARTHM